MSTRASIIVSDGNQEFSLYRHCDGYLSGLGKELKDFIGNIKSEIKIHKLCSKLEDEGIAEWDNTGIHSDVEFIYFIDLYSDYIKVSAEHCKWSKTAYDKWEETWEKLEDYTENFHY